MTSEAKLRAIAKYDALHTKQYKIKLNCETDKDLIDYLDGLENKQGTIKEALRDYMLKNKKI